MGIREESFFQANGKSNAGLSQQGLGKQQKLLQMTVVFLRRNILKEQNRRKTNLVEAWSDDAQAR